jgi:hypothetical protein
MRARWDQAPARARVRGHAGNQRLHARWNSLAAGKKTHTVACVVIARELVGWCWSLATLTDPDLPPGSPIDLARAPAPTEAARGAAPAIGL